MSNPIKKIDIISSTNVNFVNGINYVTNSLIKCNVFFDKVVVDKVYSYNNIVDVSHGKLLPIGFNVGTIRFSMKRILRNYLRKLMPSKFFLFAYIKFFLNIILPALLTVKKYLKENSTNSGFIIFQDVYSAYFYYKLSPSNRRKKTILVLHSGENVYSQLSEVFPSLFNSSYIKRINKHYNFVYKSVGKVVYISRRAHDASFLPESSKTFIYNGIQSDNFISRNKEDKLNFTTVGSINGHKGQELIIDALSSLDDEFKSKIHFYFVGGGTLLSKLRLLTKVNRLDDVVTFLGVRNDVDDILNNMDVFVLPSISERLPMSIIEGLAHGLYILTTNTGGTPELIGEGWGEFIIRDPNNIREKIISIIKNSAISEYQKRKSRQHFEKNFTLKIMAKQYESILLSL